MPVNLSSHDYQYKYQVAQGVWRWTIRMDVSGASPVFQVKDIVTPYGLLRDSVPIPGEIVTKMATNIAELTTQFSPRLLLSSLSVTITTDEGRGFSAAQTLNLTNNGMFGSILNTSLVTSAAFLKATPANLSGLASGVTAPFEVSADSTSLLAASSPYAGTITLQDAGATNSPQTVNVSVVVRPKAVIHVTPDDLAFFAGQFQVINSGPTGSILDFQIQKLYNTSAWLTSFTPSTGSLGSSVASTISVYIEPVLGMAPGTYTEYLRVSGYSTNEYEDVLITLDIT
jgi:hypothetical protein